MATNFSNKVAILADLWINYRDDENFEDFISYNDLGLPLGYIVNTELATPTDQGMLYINETFDLLCAALELDLEKDYESLQQMFELSNKKG
jgi:hypothetical protein